MFKKGYNEMKKGKSMMEGSPYEEAHESKKEKMMEGDIKVSKDSKQAHQGDVVFSNAKVNGGAPNGSGGKNMSGGSKKSATQSQVSFGSSKKKSKY